MSMDDVPVMSSGLFYQEEEFDLTDLEDFEEEDGDIFVDLSSASVVCLYPAACRVVYDYQVVRTTNAQLRSQCITPLK